MIINHGFHNFQFAAVSLATLMVLMRTYAVSQVPAKVIAVYLNRLGSPAKKKRRVKPVKTDEVGLLWSTPQQQLSCTAALLEVLAWLPNIEDRYVR
jgi:hypothetical protein